MIVARPAADRGVADLGWLDSRHTFSFGPYHDPSWMEFASLRVINEDRVQPGQGFDTHGHEDMEIVSYVLAGALEHADSTGTGAVIREGEVQRMTAGTGIRHSEFNPSDTDVVHFLQIWILPEARGLAPGYEQKAFPEEERRGRWRLIGSRAGRDGSLTIHQDVDLYATVLPRDQAVGHRLTPGRNAWIQIAGGAVRLGAQPLRAGDGAAVTEQEETTITAAEDAQVLLFDLA